MWIQPPLQSPPNVSCSTLVEFAPPHICVQPFQQSTRETFPLRQPFRQFRLHQGSRELESFVMTDTVLTSPFFLKVWAVITELTTSNFLSLRLIKIGVLRVVVVSDEDACNPNRKLFNPPSLIRSTYCHYFHTILRPSQELRFPWKPVAKLDFHPKFSILIRYSCPTHMFRNNLLLG